MRQSVESVDGAPAPPRADPTVAKPFRRSAVDLVAMFQTPDAGTPAWHRTRASTLLREAKLQPIAAITDAWWRLAARHLATADLLEQQAPQTTPKTRRRFLRHN